MKILCIAPEHSDVLAVASTLPALSQGISLAWAERFEDAAFWIFHNRDLAALVLDAQFGHEPCAALLANLQRRGLGAPTIVVADQSPVIPDALGLGPDDCLLSRSTLARDLPAAIKRVVAQRQAAPPERHTLEAELARAEAALREANARHASEIRAAGERLADRERVLASEIATLTTSHEALERRCADAEVAIRAARDSRQRAEQAAAERAARLDSDLRDALAREVSARQACEAALSCVERDRAEMNSAHAVALAELVTQLREQGSRAEAERSSSQAAHAALQRQLEEATNERHALETRLAHIAAEVDDARARHAAETAAAADRLVEQERAFASRMAELTAAHERTRTEADAQHTAALTAAARDQAALASQFGVREHALSAEIARLGAFSQALEARCADLSDRCAELHTHCGELTARRSEAEAALVATQAEARRVQDEAATLSAQRERAAEERLAREVGLRRAADVKLSRAEAAAQEAAATHAAALAALAQRLETADRARDEAEQSTARERHRAAERLAEREQVLGRQIEVLGEQAQALRGQIADAAERARGLEAQLESVVAASHEAKATHARATSEAAEQSARREQALNAQLADAVAEHVQFAREASTRERTLQESIAAEIDKRQATERALDDSARTGDAAAAAHASELAAAADRLAQREAQLAAERHAAQEARHAFEQQLERAARTHREALARATEALAVEAARTIALEADVDAALQLAEDQRGLLEAQIASLETASRDAARQHSDAMAAVVAAADQRQQQLETQRAELTAQLDALGRQLTAAARDLATTRDERNALEIEAGRANQLLRDLAELRVETARERDRHPLPLLRCDRDGTVTQVNRAFAEMVGHASADDGQRLTLATDLFKASNDLRWLVERSRTAGVVTQTESTLQTRDGRCVVVRLLSSATPSGAQVVVQDLTPQRAAQRTLDQARRLEAVGRLGTEVAVTSSQLLRDVCRDIERWLGAFDGTRAMRRRVELLLDDVARAAGHLDRLTAFGEEQANVIPSVDLHRVLHDMEPVLREIAGDEIEILLPHRAEGSLAFEVDVEADRVERLLVNVASYCRDRLPTGGSLRFELASTVVDRAFIEKYPAVRPGPHVVFTVAGVNGPIRLMGPATRREELAVAHDDPSVPSGAVGVDLGGLQALVRGCHGHLWIDAAASGDLTIRIHLPLKVA